MTLHAEIAALKARIARAEADGDAWRALGRRESYESMVEALGSQLEQLERSARLPNELDHAKKDRP